MSSDNLHKKIFPLQITKRIYIWIISLFIINAVILLGLSLENYLKLEKTEREKQLLTFAIDLEHRMPASFEEILKQHDALNKPVEEQAKILNSVLGPIVNQVSSLRPNVGMGYYSTELDKMFAVGPNFDFSLQNPLSNAYPNFNFDKSEKPEFAFYNALNIRMKEPILYKTYPIYSHGKLIGYTWASMKMESVYGAILTGVRNIFGVGFFMMGTIIFLLWVIFRKFKYDLGRFADAVAQDSPNLPEGILPEFKPLLKKVKERTDELKTVNAELQREIIEHKRTTEALLKSEKQYQMIFDNSPLGIMHLDQNGVITTCNNKFIEVIGSTKEDLIGFNMLTSLKDEAMKAAVREALSGKVGHYEGDYLTVTGNKTEPTPTKSTFSGITSSDGDFLGAVGIFEDITESKRAEEELQRTQNIVKERERLAIIGQMAAGMAHEIKNPLTAVKGFAQLLEEKCSESELQKEYAAIIIKEVEQANKVIMEFLQLARPKQPLLQLHSIKTVVEESLNVVSPQAFLKKIDLKYEGIKELPRCMIDRSQIKQVLFNMCKNAIEALPEGGIIRISTGFLDEQNEVFIEIQDNGCGIPEEKFENIGIPFYTTKADGTGLGLSISYSIIDAHKGRVEVKSKEGEGTSFRVYLPCRRDEERQ